MLVTRPEQCQTAHMRFLAGLRLVLVAAALIGLLAGRSAVFPVAAAHAEMAMATADTSLDCCDKSGNALADQAGLGDTCTGPGCSMIAPALLPVSPILAETAVRSAAVPGVVTGLDGRALPPPLEPPRA